MEKLLKEYIELMKQLRAANADLYVKFVEFVRKAQQEFAQQAGGGIGPSRPVALEIASGGDVAELTLVGGPEGGAARAHVVNGGFTCDQVREQEAGLLLRRSSL